MRKSNQGNMVNRRECPHFSYHKAVYINDHSSHEQHRKTKFFIFIVKENEPRKSKDSMIDKGVLSPYICFSVDGPIIENEVQGIY